MTTVRIPLHSRKYPGLVAVIDADDYALVSQYRWFPKVRPGLTTYAATGHKEIKMHRLIMSPPDGLYVDHINGDGLDNRRCNLRIATHAENVRNIHHRPDSGAGYRGVHYHAGGWAASIKTDGVRVWLGSFTTPEAAASAYDIAVRKAHAEFGKSNQDLGLLRPEDALPESEVEHYRIRREGSSRYRGVSWNKEGRKWTAKVYANGRQYYLGRFTDEVEAATAHDREAIRLCGDDAILNFRAAGITKGEGDEQ